MTPAELERVPFKKRLQVAFKITSHRPRTEAAIGKHMALQAAREGHMKLLPESPHYVLKEKRRSARELYRQGKSQRQIMTALGISKSDLNYALYKEKEGHQANA